MRTSGVVVLGLLYASALAGQQSVSEQLAGRLSPPVIATVAALADSAAARGLPSEPIVDKAIEGSTKGVPEARIVSAARAVLDELDVAATAARTGGVGAPGPDLIEAGAFGLNAGLHAADVTELVRGSQAPYPPGLVLRVAGTLTALGVPAAQAVRAVERALATHASPADLADLPRELQLGMAHGVSAGDAADGLGHGAPHWQGGGGGSPPPGAVTHGPPSQLPPSPPHGKSGHGP